MITRYPHHRAARPAGIARHLTMLALIISLLLSAGRPAEIAASSGSAPGGTPPAPPPITVLLDGLPVEFDVPPMIMNDRTLVPFRFLAEALGCDVEWDGEARVVTAVDRYTGRVIVLLVDNTEARVDDELRVLDVPARIIGDRTLIPLRFFSEALDAKVEWVNDTRTIVVASPRRPLVALGYYALGDTNETSWQSLFGAPYPNAAVGATDIFSEVVCAWFVLVPETGTLNLNDRYSMQVRPNSWREVLAEAARHGLRTEMMIHGMNSSGQFDLFLSNAALMQKAILEIAGYALDFDGVHLDLEYLGRGQTGEELEATREKFNLFVRHLATTLHAQGKTLTVCLHAPNSWFKGYDYATLGEIADRVVIMAYIYNQGPQALPKVTEAVDMALALVPREKLILALLVGKDNTYETAESLLVKIGLVKRRGLAGIAVWRISVLGKDRTEALRSSLYRPVE